MHKDLNWYTPGRVAFDLKKRMRTNLLHLIATTMDELDQPLVHLDEFPNKRRIMVKGLKEFRPLIQDLLAYFDKLEALYLKHYISQKDIDRFFRHYKHKNLSDNTEEPQPQNETDSPITAK